MELKGENSTKFKIKTYVDGNGFSFSSYSSSSFLFFYIGEMLKIRNKIMLFTKGKNAY